MELTARLSMQGIHWPQTRAFMVPSGECGYIRLNVKGRERDGIVERDEAPPLLEHIASALQTFCDPDGVPAVKKVEGTSSFSRLGSPAGHFPDLVVHWSDRLPAHYAGLRSAQFGDVPSPGWGSGRTGEHRDGAWALLNPGTSALCSLGNPPNILDVAPTICRVLGAEQDGLTGQSWLEPARH
jgi:predicted AlkP superfamily phosphohydrolase/phosphomutase